MRTIKILAMCSLMASPLVGHTYTDTQLKTALQSGKTYLLAHDNADGSWGEAENIKPLYTAEAVLALRNVAPFIPEHTKGVTWLANHNSDSHWLVDHGSNCTG
jgi:hypothetical protein